MKALFYDTYALFEIIEGNKSYEPYKKIDGLILTRLQLMELYYGLLTKFGKGIAEKYYEKLVDYAQEVTDSCIKQAMVFRLQHKEKKFSYVDCIGYIMAQQNHIPFLTGDKQFEDLPHVIFVK